jgi:hypothetical protein
MHRHPAAGGRGGQGSQLATVIVGVQRSPPIDLRESQPSKHQE